MIHLKNTGFAPENAREIVYKARELAADMNASVRIARVAKNFIELDVAVEKKDLDEIVSRFTPIGPIDNVRHVIEEEIGKEQGIQDGVFYFNNERFWESHEAFEGVWKQCFGREKDLVQGIILMAVAFAHAQKNDASIGIGMLRRVLEKLEDSPSMYHNIDIDRMRNKALSMQKANSLAIFEI